MIGKNLSAFLTAIAYSEGTEQIGDKHGYDVIVGSTTLHPHLFISYATHPGIIVDLGHGLKSTAAGRYQILKRFYDFYSKTLKLPDFSPESQDQMAIQMIRECKALQLVHDGNIKEATKLCASRWASLPDSDYGQHTNNYDFILAEYMNAGGTLA